MDFSEAAELLRILHKYNLQTPKMELVSRLSSEWPSTLAEWDVREAKATNAMGAYSPRESLPHPV